MYKSFTITSILVFGLVNMQAFASEEAEQIRQECEMQVQSYGITDSAEYNQAIEDCVESMLPQSPAEQYESDSMPADQT